jgi:hypothetical protein
MALDPRASAGISTPPTENQFGDILSDLGAALVGGMGLQPSADGEKHGSSSPGRHRADIAGKASRTRLPVPVRGDGCRSVSANGTASRRRSRRA